MRRLDLRFGTRNAIRAKTALEARRRQTGEDFRNYAEDVRSLTRIARPEFSKEVIDALAADKLLRYLARTAWWQPKKSSAGLPFDTLVEQALECKELSSERAQLRGSGQEYTVASLIPDEEEDEDEPASPIGRRAREAQRPRETNPGLGSWVPATTPTETVTPGDWLRELVAGITGATSLVEGEVNGVRTRILLDTGAVASLVSAAHCSAIGVDVRHLQAPDRALHTASGAGMGLLGRATLEVCHAAATKPFSRRPI
ncbi:unnamed protein product [Lampetra fluviatilis]